MKTTLSANGPCFLDDDGDGRFDRQLGRNYDGIEAEGSSPVHKAACVRRGQGSGPLHILYQGATSDTVRFSYREFKNDLARPAFTEELTIPREPFPQMAMLKNVQVRYLVSRAWV
jgi:hypothetical protein